MRICYVFPSRTRPMKFFDALDNIQDMSYTGNFFIWAKLDLDDPAISEYKEYIKDYPELTVKWGLSKSKVDACNRSMEDLPECDIIILFSDDMKWLSFGFDEEIRKAFADYFPDFSGVIHFPDSHAVNRTMTLTIMGVNLYKQLGYLYHPDFESVYADNHLTEMTRQMGKYKFINKKLFDHYHPIWQMSEWDDQYKASEAPAVYKRDHDTYQRLKAINFGL